MQMTRRLFIAAVLAVTVLVASPARAEPPQITAKRAEAQRVLAQIQQLDDELGRTIEAYKGAAIELDRIRAMRDVNNRHLRIARTNLRVARHALGERLAALYRSADSDSTLALLFGSRSFGDFLGRLDAVNRIGDQDSQVLAEIERFKQEVETRAVRLKLAHARQAALVAKRAEARRRIEAGLAERQRLLSSIRDEVKRLEAEEARRQAALQHQAEARLRAQQEAERRAAEARRAAAERGTPAATEPAPVVGAAAMTPSGYTVAPAARYGGVVEIAMQYLGVPYKWGGASPEEGFDCSGLVQYVFGKLGVSLPHYTVSLYQMGTPVSRDQLEPGDLVFFSGLGHMGIYIGGGQMIHAPRTGDVVKISSIDEPWRIAGWVGARRL